MNKLILLICFFVPSLLMAQNFPWCHIMDEIETCAFIDAESCYEAVARSGGSCRGNPEAFGKRGNRQYCVVTENMRDCTFANQQGCLRVAQTLNGGCVPNFEYSELEDFLRKLEEYQEQNF